LSGVVFSVMEILRKHSGVCGTPRAPLRPSVLVPER